MSTGEASMVWYIIAVIVAVIVVPFVAWSLYAAQAKRTAFGPRVWHNVGLPPRHLDLALGMIRFEATRTFGDAVLKIRWGGFIYWESDGASRIGDPDVPGIHVRWKERVEETELIPLLLLWIASRLPTETRASMLLPLAARLRSDLAVQLNRNAYVSAAEPTAEKSP
jgi:hypothetical protein